MTEVVGKCPHCGSLFTKEKRAKDIEISIDDVLMTVEYVCIDCDEEFEAEIHAKIKDYIVI
jgi:DNA-directed RNA polymerase subunit RPC12/RpoP